MRSSQIALLVFLISFSCLGKGKKKKPEKPPEKPKKEKIFHIPIRNNTLRIKEFRINRLKLDFSRTNRIESINPMFEIKCPYSYCFKEDLEYVLMFNIKF